MGRKRKKQQMMEGTNFDSQSKRKKQTVNMLINDESLEHCPPISTMKPLTLKIRLGNEIVTTERSDNIKAPSTLDVCQSSTNYSGHDDSVSVGGESLSKADFDLCIDTKQVTKIKDDEEYLDDCFLDDEEEDDDDDDEELWLEALESGNVDDTGYLHRAVNTTTMTARQRALFESKEDELLELPISTEKNKAQNEDDDEQEMLLKKTERNRKRRLQAIKRREMRKAETVQKLLHKQSRKKDDKEKKKFVCGSHLRYLNQYDGVFISVTNDLKYSVFQDQKLKSVSPIVTCKFCSCPKRYNDSVTNIPLCSLNCYKLLHLNAKR